MLLIKLINNSFGTFHTMKQYQRLQQGQGMTEYIIILSLVAVAAITVFGAFGGVNRAQVAAVANEIAGNHQGAKDSIQLAQNYARYASDSASYSRNMGNYNSSPDWSNYSGGGSSGSDSSGSDSSGSDSSGSDSSGSGGSGSGGSGSSASGGSGTGNSTDSGGSTSGENGIEVTGAPPVVGSGQVTNQSVVDTTSTNSSGSIQYKGITIITKGGDINRIKKSIDKLPSKVLTILSNNGVKIAAVKDSVTEYLTHLKGVHPRNWPPGKTWDVVPGAQSNGVVVVATSSKFPTPTVDIVLHEIGHAYDKVKGYPSRQPKFINISSSILSGSWYFTHGKAEANLSEKYAETFARFYSGYTKISTNASNYWRNHE